MNNRREHREIPPVTPPGKRLRADRLAFLRTIDGTTTISRPDLVPSTITRELLAEIDRLADELHAS